MSDCGIEHHNKVITDCLRCGAPVCCPDCCFIDTLFSENKKLQEENKKLKTAPLYESNRNLVSENEKLKEAMKAELKRCGGTVPILSECLEELE